jgi:tetratricopeptide (TPR) repeat protein/DNA-binding winged helix-turn-helix (wHTH) protein
MPNAKIDGIEMVFQDNDFIGRLATTVEAGEYEQLVALVCKQGCHLRPDLWFDASSILRQLPDHIMAQHPYLLAYLGRYTSEQSPAAAWRPIRSAIEKFKALNDEVGELVATLYLIELQFSLAKGLQLQEILPRFVELVANHSDKLEVTEKINLLTYQAAMEVYLTGNSNSVNAYLDKAEVLQREYMDLPELVAPKIFRAVDHIFHMRLDQARRAVEALGRIPHSSIRATHLSLIYAVQANWLTVSGNPQQLRYLFHEATENLPASVLDEGHTGAYFDTWIADSALLSGEYAIAADRIREGQEKYSVQTHGDVRNQWRWTAARIYAEAGDHDEAHSLLDLVTELTPIVAFKQRQRLVVATTYLALGLNEEARTLLEHAVSDAERIYPNFIPTAHGFLYLVYHRLANEQLAHAHLQVWIDEVQSSNPLRFTTVGYTRANLLELLTAARNLDDSEQFDHAARQISSVYLDTLLDDQYKPVSVLNVRVSDGSIFIAGYQVDFTKLQRKIIHAAAFASQQQLSTKKLCRQLWPNLVTAENRLYAAVFRMKKVLQDAGCMPDNYIESINGGFHLKNCRIDVEEFNRLWSIAEQHIRGRRQWEGFITGLEALDAWDGLVSDSILMTFDQDDWLRSQINRYANACRLLRSLASTPSLQHRIAIHAKRVGLGDITSAPEVQN